MARTVSSSKALLARILAPSAGCSLSGEAVRFVGPALVVKVVEQSGDAPEFLVRAVLAGVGAQALTAKHVLAEAFGLRVFA